MGEELLRISCERGDLREASLLLEGGRARADCALPPTLTTPLHVACRAQSLEVVQLLLRHRADPNAHEIRPCGGRTALHLAAQKDCPGITAALLKAGASPVALDSRGMTPLHLAAQEGLVDVTRLLLAHGADPLLRDKAGCNAAWWAKDFGHPAVEAVYAELQVLPRILTAKEAVKHAQEAMKNAPARPTRKKKAAARPRSASRAGASGPAPGRRASSQSQPRRR